MGIVVVVLMVDVGVAGFEVSASPHTENSQCVVRRGGVFTGIPGQRLQSHMDFLS
jgi:hypothetical protein